MSKSVFYHVGCPACESAEHDIINLISHDNVEVVHIGEDTSRIDEAESVGVKSVPALLIAFIADVRVQFISLQKLGILILSQTKTVLTLLRNSG